MQIRRLFLERQTDHNGRECLSGEVEIMQGGTPSTVVVNDVVRTDGANGLAGLNHVKYTPTNLGSGFVLNLAYGTIPWPPPRETNDAHQPIVGTVPVTSAAKINELEIVYQDSTSDYELRIIFDNLQVDGSLILEPAVTNAPYINPVGQPGIGDFYPYYRIVKGNTGNFECINTAGELTKNKQYGFVITDDATSDPRTNPKEGNIFVFNLQEN